MMRLFILLALILNQASAANASRRSMLLGGYMPIADPEDPYVLSIAEFAVTEHNNQASDALAFVDVTKGERQEVDGVNYKLVIVAIKVDGSVHSYLAEVFVSLSEDHKNLNSFDQLADTSN